MSSCANPPKRKAAVLQGRAAVPAQVHIGHGRHVEVELKNMGATMWMKPIKKPEICEVDLLNLELFWSVLELGAEELDHQPKPGSCASQLVMLSSEAIVQISDCVMLTSHQIQHLGHRQQSEHEPGCLHLVLGSAVGCQIDQHVGALNGSHDQIPHAPVHHYEHVAALGLQRLI